MIKISNEQKEVYTEVIKVLSCMEMKYQEKVPKELIEFFKANSLENYKFNIDTTIPLKEQILKPKTLSILAMLDLNYWCENDGEKQKLINKYSENEKKCREENNVNNLFEKINKENKKQENPIQNNESMVEYKESIFKKFINKIKKIIKM